MIIAIANQNGGSGKTFVANCLAALRARSGRKVLLLDTDPKASLVFSSVERGAASIRPSAIGPRGFQAELESLHPHYKDIVIDTEGRDTLESRAALIAARLVIVPVQAEQVSLASQYKLVARLNSARMFNPGLRVLFVIVVVGSSNPSEQERAAIRAHVAQVMSAKLAGTVIHVQRALPCDAAPAAGEHAGCDARALEEMNALYREVFAR